MTADTITFPELLTRLGYGTHGGAKHENVSVCHQPVGGSFNSDVTGWDNAPGLVRAILERYEWNLWFGVNALGVVTKGRGKVDDVTRLCALYADLDFKDGGCPDMDAALDIVDDVSGVVGERPVAITHSGHGVQPYWAVDVGSALTLRNGEAKGLLERFGRLVKAIAAHHGCEVDSVFDLPRVLRVPDTDNLKDPDNPVRVQRLADVGKPLTVEAIRAALDTYGITEERPRVRVSGNGQGPVPDEYYSRGCLINRVAKSARGYRNKTLFGATLDAAKQGDLDDEMYQALETAADECGLSWDDGSESIAKTMESAVRTAEGQGYEIDGNPWTATRTRASFRARSASQGDQIPYDDEEDAGEPVPLTQTVDVPSWPVDALPQPIADMVDGVAEATQVDPAMPATSALSALSACTGGYAEIEIRPGWREPECLYTATIAVSGERKSAVQQFMTRPIHDVERRLVADIAADRMAAEERKQVATKAVERQRNAAARTGGRGAGRGVRAGDRGGPDRRRYRGAAVPRLLADDITPEAAASLLAEQGGRLAIISAEGGIFDIIAGRYSPKANPNMDLWLKGHSGDPLRVDRKGRPPEHIPRPALTLGLMIQPAVLAAIAANHQFRGRGFLARILYARPVSKVGHRKTPAPPVDPEVELSYGTTLRDLARGMRGWAGDPAVLTLTEAAQQELQRIEATVEPTLAGDGELASLADWGAKYVGAVARIAGMLHLAEHGADKGPREPVSAQTVMAAARIGDYFKAAAINAFAEMGTDQGTADAVYLLDRIRHLGQDEVSERDLFTAASRGRFKTTEDLRPALHRLVDHGYLVCLPKPKPTGGRPASPRYMVIAEAAETAEAAEGYS